MRLLTALVRALVPLALAGVACSSITGESGDVSVRIRNASQSTLTAVRVATGPDDEISEPSIAPGQTTAERSVHSIYSAVAVNLNVDGKAVAAIPVEGFVDGFNQRLEAGRYVVVINILAGSSPSQPLLNVVVAKDP